MTSDASGREVDLQSGNHATASQVVEWRHQASRLRRRAANAVHEAAMLAWLAAGCPSDRTGIMGVSLIGTSKIIFSRIRKAGNP